MASLIRSSSPMPDGELVLHSLFLGLLRQVGEVADRRYCQVPPCPRLGHRSRPLVAPPPPPPPPPPSLSMLGNGIVELVVTKEPVLAVRLSLEMDECVPHSGVDVVRWVREEIWRLACTAVLASWPHSDGLGARHRGGVCRATPAKGHVDLGKGPTPHPH
jgi:hypothetical protein